MISANEMVILINDNFRYELRRFGVSGCLLLHLASYIPYETQRLSIQPSLLAPYSDDVIRNHDVTLVDDVAEDLLTWMFLLFSLCAL